MTAVWIAVLATGVGCYLLKLAGLSLPHGMLERPAVRRFAATVPIALLAALIAVQTFADGRDLSVDGPRLAGLGAAAVALLLRAPFLVVLLVAAATAAGLRLLL